MLFCMLASVQCGADAGWGESVATSPAGHHLSMPKIFPVMPAGWTALLDKKIKIVGIFGCWAYMAGGY